MRSASTQPATRCGPAAASPYVAAAGVALPFVVPDYRAQIAMLWALVIMAQTWDITGGQTGYNSFGNILFFGVGMYASVVVQRDVGLDYFPGLVLGMAVGAAIAAALAVLLGSMILRMRGHYFAIATLGLGIAAGEIAGGWDYVGAGSGLSPPLFPAAPGTANLFFAYLFFCLAALVFVLLAALYRTRFGLALNAIRDNEDKAEAMGLHTGALQDHGMDRGRLLPRVSSAGAMGNMLGFVDPRDTAFAGATFGVWMVLMAILGGKGTLWGPLLGATIFHITQELLWTHLLGWQRVALGVIIVGIVVFFPQGILGWARTRWPARHEPNERESGASMSAQLTVQGATKHLGGVTANDDISLEVPEGKVVGLIGPNGSGKSTLFNSIVGYHPVDGGSIRFEGREITRLRTAAIARLGLIRSNGFQPKTGSSLRSQDPAFGLLQNDGLHQSIHIRGGARDEIFRTSCSRSVVLPGRTARAGSMALLAWLRASSTPVSAAGLSVILRVNALAFPAIDASCWSSRWR